MYMRAWKYVCVKTCTHIRICPYLYRICVCANIYMDVGKDVHVYMKHACVKT